MALRNGPTAEPVAVRHSAEQHHRERDQQFGQRRMRVLVDAQVLQILFAGAGEVDLVEHLVAAATNSRRTTATKFATPKAARHARSRAARALRPDLRADRTIGARRRRRQRRSVPALRIPAAHPTCVACRGFSAEKLVTEPEEHAYRDQREDRRRRSPEVLRVDSGHVVLHHLEILQRVLAGSRTARARARPHSRGTGERTGCRRS